MIAADASALVAIILGEPERETLEAAICRSDRVLISPVTIIEARIAVRRQMGDAGLARLDALITRPPFEVAPVTAADVDIAWTAFLAYGKGSGSGARLNLGDLFSYAVAKRWQAPLLYKGDDFSRTDLPAAALPA